VTDLIKPGAGIIFMKVGIHAQEPLDKIIARKRREIADTTYAMWGYGGNTCHPRTMVQPFAETHTQHGEPIYLLMEEMISNHWGEPVTADEYSIDGEEWMKIPPTINVKGSRFALTISSLDEQTMDLPLNQTRVAAGLNRGRRGSRYIRGRVDKACLEITADTEQVNESDDVPTAPIKLVARVVPPYAVFLRGSR
jgi:hypothetical protein